MRVSFRVDGMDRIIRSFGKPVKPLLQRVIMDVGEIARDFVKLYIPKRTYKLHDTIMAVQGNGLTVNIIEGKFYGGILRAGAPRHDIFPRTKKALYWPGAEHPVRMVDHPGFRPVPYDEQAAAATIGSMQGTLQNTAGDIADQLTGG